MIVTVFVPRVRIEVQEEDDSQDSREQKEEIGRRLGVQAIQEYIEVSGNKKNPFLDLDINLIQVKHYDLMGSSGSALLVRDIKLSHEKSRNEQDFILAS